MHFDIVKVDKVQLMLMLLFTPQKLADTSNRKETNEDTVFVINCNESHINWLSKQGLDELLKCRSTLNNATLLQDAVSRIIVFNYEKMSCQLCGNDLWEFCPMWTHNYTYKVWRIFVNESTRIYSMIPIWLKILIEWKSLWLLTK